MDDRWLHDRINEDPSILGLGDLDVMAHERKQASGGRIDFLMREPETDMMYEIEVMLGRLDESHIIRTIEYWDLERRRWQKRDHTAVIVAEEITNRFFNVIGLLNRSVPIMAIQLNVLRVDEKIILDFTRVLDVYEPPVEDEEGEPTDRGWWEGRAKSESLEVLDRAIALFTNDENRPRVTCNKHHIAFGGSRRNFGWFRPRKRPYCHVELYCSESEIPSVVEILEGTGVNLRGVESDTVNFNLLKRDHDEHPDDVRLVLQKAADTTGGGLG